LAWHGENPAPGSDAALDQGCICPVLDNAHGGGLLNLGRDWWVTEGCPLHWTNADAIDGRTASHEGPPVNL
jgi:hypothetical protein